MKSTDPDTIAPTDQAKLIAVYKCLCPDDQMTDDDPRRPVIAAEVLDVGRAPNITAALEVIEYWRQPAAWAIEFVSSVRRSVGRMKLQANYRKLVWLRN
jgi:hypothetical protein